MGFDIETIFDLMNSEKDRLTSSDFNVVYSDLNGQWVRISEINEMIKCGAISFDEEKLDAYKLNRICR